MLAVRLDLCDPGVWRCQFHANIELNWWICSNTCLSLSIDTSPSPPGSYRGCTVHCDSCGKCVFLCQEHSGCTCYAAAFEMLCTAHLLVSNDLLFDVLIWSVLLKTLWIASNLSSNLPNKKLKKKKIHEILYVVRDAFIYVLAEFVR